MPCLQKMLEFYKCYMYIFLQFLIVYNLKYFLHVEQIMKPHIIIAYPRACNYIPFNAAGATEPSLLFDISRY